MTNLNPLSAIYHIIVTIYKAERTEKLKMIFDGLGHVYNVDSERNRIGYKDHDGYIYNVIHDYQTMFAYFKEYVRQPDIQFTCYFLGGNSVQTRLRCSLLM